LRVEKHDRDSGDRAAHAQIHVRRIRIGLRIRRDPRAIAEGVPRLDDAARELLLELTFSRQVA
jgi:hypothetical protein